MKKKGKPMIRKDFVTQESFDWWVVGEGYPKVKTIGMVNGVMNYRVKHKNKKVYDCYITG